MLAEGSDRAGETSAKRWAGSIARVLPNGPDRSRFEGSEGLARIGRCMLRQAQEPSAPALPQRAGSPAQINEALDCEASAMALLLLTSSGGDFSELSPMGLGWDMAGMFGARFHALWGEDEHLAQRYCSKTSAFCLLGLEAQNPNADWRALASGVGAWLEAGARAEPAWGVEGLAARQIASELAARVIQASLGLSDAALGHRATLSAALGRSLLQARGEWMFLDAPYFVRRPEGGHANHGGALTDALRSIRAVALSGCPALDAIGMAMDAQRVFISSQAVSRLVGNPEATALARLEREPGLGALELGRAASALRLARESAAAALPALALGRHLTRLGERLGARDAGADFALQLLRKAEPERNWDGVWSRVKPLFASGFTHNEGALRACHVHWRQARELHAEPENESEVNVGLLVDG